MNRDVMYMSALFIFHLDLCALSFLHEDELGFDQNNKTKRYCSREIRLEYGVQLMLPNRLWKTKKEREERDWREEPLQYHYAWSCKCNSLEFNGTVMLFKNYTIRFKALYSEKKTFEKMGYFSSKFRIKFPLNSFY